MENVDVDKTRDLFVMLACTETRVSKMIKRAVTAEYTHSAIAFDRQLKEIYSFGRRKMNNVFNAGFIKENLDTGIYAINPEAPCILYRFRVSAEQYDKARNIIDDFMADYDKHKYNIMGLFYLNFNKELKRKYKYACSQFVALVLTESGVVSKLKQGSIWMTKPDDLQDLPGAEIVFKGKLKDVRNIDGTGNEILKENK